LTESLTVYGFGSFFNGKAQPHDIDLLLLHRSTDFESCKFAIECKAQLKLALPSADIVMLSQAEAKGLNFLKRAKAVKLTDLSSDSMDANLQTLVHRLLDH
jgi:hypothetical protein